MHAGTIMGIIGIVLSALGALWYWRIKQLAPQFASAFTGATMPGNFDQSAKYAIAIVCFGFVLFLIGMTVSFLSKNEDA